MSTWGIVGTGSPLQDLSASDYEDLIYKDIGDKWSLTTPAYNVDLTKAKIFATTTKADMVNRPQRFLGPIWIWVQHQRSTSARTDTGSTLGKTGYIAHESTYRIHIFLKRLTAPALTFPELGQIAREIERILYQYPQSNPPEITGLQHFDNFIEESVSEVTNMGEGFGGVYRKICQVDAYYWKASTI